MEKIRRGSGGDSRREISDGKYNKKVWRESWKRVIRESTIGKEREKVERECDESDLYPRFISRQWESVLMLWREILFIWGLKAKQKEKMLVPTFTHFQTIFKNFV